MFCCTCHVGECSAVQAYKHACFFSSAGASSSSSSSPHRLRRRFFKWSENHIDKEGSSCVITRKDGFPSITHILAPGESLDIYIRKANHYIYTVLWWKCYSTLMQQFIIIAYNARFFTTPTLCAFKDPFIRCINAPSMNAGEIVSDAAYMTINFSHFIFSHR